MNTLIEIDGVGLSALMGSRVREGSVKGGVFLGGQGRPRGGDTGKILALANVWNLRENGLLQRPCYRSASPPSDHAGSRNPEPPCLGRLWRTGIIIFGSQGREKRSLPPQQEDSQGKKRSIHVVNGTLFLPITEERKGTFPSGSGERKGPLWGEKPALVNRKETPAERMRLTERENGPSPSALHSKGVRWRHFKMNLWKDSFSLSSSHLMLADGWWRLIQQGVNWAQSNSLEPDWMMLPSHLNSGREEIAWNCTVTIPVMVTSFSWPEALSPTQSTCSRVTPFILTPALRDTFHCYTHSTDKETKPPELKTLLTSDSQEVMELASASWCKLALWLRSPCLSFHGQHCSQSLRDALANQARSDRRAGKIRRYVRFPALHLAAEGLNSPGCISPKFLLMRMQPSPQSFRLCTWRTCLLSRSYLVEQNYLKSHTHQVPIGKIIPNVCLGNCCHTDLVLPGCVWGSGEPSVLWRLGSPWSKLQEQAHSQCYNKDNVPLFY